MQPVHLLVGDDDLLLQRKLEDTVAGLRAEDPEIDVATYDLAELEQLPELRTTSLFGGRPAVVLRGRGSDIRAELRAELSDYLKDPDPEAVLVLGVTGLGSANSPWRSWARPGAPMSARRRTTRTPRGTRLSRTSSDDWPACRSGGGRRHPRPRRVRPSAIAAKVGQVVAGTTGDVGADDVGTSRRGSRQAEWVAIRNWLKAVSLLGLSNKQALRCKNFLALGLTSWLFQRPIEPTIRWIEQKFSRRRRRSPTPTCAS